MINESTTGKLLASKKLVQLIFFSSLLVSFRFRMSVLQKSFSEKKKKKKNRNGLKSAPNKLEWSTLE